MIIVPSFDHDPSQSHLPVYSAVAIVCCVIAVARKIGYWLVEREHPHETPEMANWIG